MRCDRMFVVSLIALLPIRVCLLITYYIVLFEKVIPTDFVYIYKSQICSLLTDNI